MEQHADYFINEDLVLRKAVIGDLSIIVDIVQNKVVPIMNQQDNNYQWNPTYPLYDDFYNDIQNDTLWIAEVNHQIAGVVALTTDQSEEYGLVGWDLSEICMVPHRLAVDPQQRGKKIAYNFMLLAEKLAKEKGYKYVRVDTNEKNIPMQKLFEKLQYNYTGKISFKKEPMEIYKDLVFFCYEKCI